MERELDKINAEIEDVDLEIKAFERSLARAKERRQQLEKEREEAEKRAAVTDREEAAKREVEEAKNEREGLVKRLAEQRRAAAEKEAAAKREAEERRKAAERLAEERRKAAEERRKVLAEREAAAKREADELRKVAAEREAAARREADELRKAAAEKEASARNGSLEMEEDAPVNEVETEEKPDAAAEPTEDDELAQEERRKVELQKRIEELRRQIQEVDEEPDGPGPAPTKQPPSPTKRITRRGSTSPVPTTPGGRKVIRRKVVRKAKDKENGSFNSPKTVDHPKVLPPVAPLDEEGQSQDSGGDQESSACIPSTPNLDEETKGQAPDTVEPSHGAESQSEPAAAAPNPAQVSEAPRSQLSIASPTPEQASAQQYEPLPDPILANKKTANWDRPAWATASDAPVPEQDVITDSLQNPMLKQPQMSGYVRQIKPGDMKKVGGKFVKPVVKIPEPRLVWIVVNIDGRKVGKIVMHLHGNVAPILDKFFGLKGMKLDRHGKELVVNEMDPPFYVTTQLPEELVGKKETYGVVQEGQDILDKMLAADEGAVLDIKQSHIYPVKRARSS